MSLLTAIVPVHKMSGRLEELKHWVCESLKLNIRIILVHDFGDFDTEKELEDFIKTQDSSDLVFISGQFGGPGLARNAAMHRITTEYFCFWDSDDIPLVQNFYEMVCAAAENEIEIVVGEFETTIKNSYQYENSANAKFPLIDQVALDPGLWRMAFQSKRFIEQRFRNLLLAEDQLFLVDLDFAEHKLSGFPKVVYRYNIDSLGSLTKQRSNLFHICSSLDVIKSKLKSIPPQQSREFLLVVWLKQSLTLVKLGSFNLKKVGMSNLGLILLNSNYQEKVALIKLAINWREKERR